MNYRAFFTLALMCISLHSLASMPLDKTAIKNMVIEHLEKVYTDHYGQVDLSSRFVFHTSNLDNRLKLSECSAPISKQITSPSPLARQISVKVACEGTSPWTIYVPVRVDSFADVAVASRSLHRGEQITIDDITFTRVNISQVSNGYFESVVNLVGMELKRGIRAGTTITKSTLKAPTIIKRGETVSLEASGAGIAVVTNAKALSAGKLGQQIQVQNLSTQRKVFARVVGPGRVQVAL